MSVITDTEGALRRLPLKFRRRDLGNGVLYFCEDPGQTAFNLTLDKNGNLRIWHFLMVTLPQNSEIVRVQRQFNDFCAGIEITDDNVLCFDVCQDISVVPDDQCPEVLIRRIENFLILSSRIRQSFLNFQRQEVS